MEVYTNNKNFWQVWTMGRDKGNYMFMSTELQNIL